MGVRRGGLRVAPSGRFWPLLSYLVLVIILPHVALASLATTTNPIFKHQPIFKRAANGSSTLECLQVAAPVLSPDQGCQQTLMSYIFALSYGQPFVGKYQSHASPTCYTCHFFIHYDRHGSSLITNVHLGFYKPPACQYNRVTINFTVTSAGRQFDRLGYMFLGDVEVFRTSTAEPTKDGIAWTYVKDMTAYLSLFKDPQKIIFDLGNLIDDTYTGSWNTTLIATFFTEPDTTSIADLIVPISAKRSAANQSSAFIVPEAKAIDTLSLPRNIQKAVVSIAACGQATEEFWWSNVLTSDTTVFGNDTQLYGHSAFRELQVLIDGTIAGVAWPFPVIFTGGVVPGFWRPLVGIDAFNLREDEIDVSPFIPLLSDGKPHTFEIRVVGIDDDGKGRGTLTESIGSNWPVTGKVFVWLDTQTNITTGTIVEVDASEPDVTLYSWKNGATNNSVSTLKYAAYVTRRLSIESTIQTSNGSRKVSWHQDLHFSNEGTLSNQGNDQDVTQSTMGTHMTSSGYNRRYSYPLSVTSSYNVLSGGNFTIEGNFTRGKRFDQEDDLAFLNDWRTFDYTKLPTKPPRWLSTRGSLSDNMQEGTASYLGVPAQGKSYGTGSTQEQFEFGMIGPEPQDNMKLYKRSIAAKNDAIVYDDQVYGAQEDNRLRTFSATPPADLKAEQEYAVQNIRAMIGRGPK